MLISIPLPLLNGDHTMSISTLPLISIGLPLFGWATIFFFRSFPKSIIAAIACGTVLGAFVCAAIMGFHVLHNGPITIHLIHWFTLPPITFDIGLRADSLSVLMALMVTGVGFLVHLYSVGYMADDADFNRYFCYLNLFVFFMLVLVLADGFLGTFVGWEGVGLCSYLLIGFWYTNPSYINAASKAFIMNRIGDVGLLIGIGLILTTFGTLNYATISASIATLPVSPIVALAICICLIIAVSGKSAQLPLYTWLPDAMAGPTPVSALIHAATMVTAGIYLVARTAPLFSLAPEAGSILITIGVLTSILGGVVAVFQFDIKKVLAYSTVSQLGFMVVALGLGSYQAALFHMLTHAFFKALLFLGAGSVLHSLSGEQDMRKMGGLYKKIPVTATYMLIGMLAISGFPPLSGFFSKEGILESALHHSIPLFLTLMAISALTTFYMSRMMGLVFLGTYKGDRHPHEPGIAMQIPMAILAILSVIAGYMAPHHPLNVGLTVAAVVSALIMGVSGYLLSHRQRIQPVRVFELPELDRIYDWLFVKPYLYLSRVFIVKFDRGLTAVTSTAAKSVVFTAKGISRVQTGNIGTYLFIMLIFILVLIAKIVVM